ncbi:hypothetical protein [Actinoplanes sp. NPDC049802]|uniref:hypothetical protein n=1 Tax=Actinoplanes sp. NPDC049802 TaxID=3154742 RepID=UPI0033D58DCE
MKNVEDLVGAAVRDLADNAPRPLDLAAAARTRGRRIRRRRRTAIGTAALALTVVAAAPFVIVREQAPDSPATPPPAPSMSATTAAKGVWEQQPYQLPGGLVVTALTRIDVGSDNPAGKTLKDGNVALDRVTGRYWALPWDYYTIWGAPAGAGSLVSDGSSNLLSVGGEGVLPTPIPGGAELPGPQWSRDGRRLLDTVHDGYVIRDGVTGRITSRGGGGATATCPDFCYFTWLANGTEVALPRVDPKVPQSEAKPDTIKDIVVYSIATGQRIRTLPVAGVPVDSDSWSPDGRFVMVFDQAFQTRPKHVVDVETGKTVGRIPGTNVHFLPDGRILSIRDTKAEVYDVRGALVESQTLPADFAGRTVSVGTL